MSDLVPAPPSPWGEALREVGEQLRQPTEGLRQLLQEVVARAVTAVGAAEGSILVPDGEQDLRFLVSHSPASARLAGLRVPIAGSIAGYVLGTGQMTAVGDLQEQGSPQFYAEIDRQVGVATRTYLVVPILLGSRVSGVATYVNRPSQPPYQPFQQHEMEEARKFAALEAVLLRHLERTRQLAQLAGHDLAAALAALRAGAAGPAAAPPAQPEGASDPWVRALGEMEGLPEEDLALCFDFVELVARRRGRALS
jgi:GAF domain-containing protein